MRKCLVLLIILSCFYPFKTCHAISEEDKEKLIEAAMKLVVPVTENVLVPATNWATNKIKGWWNSKKQPTMPAWAEDPAAIQDVKKKAKDGWFSKGDPESQYKLGFISEHGFGVPQDANEAENWYRKSAKQGFADGQYSLARLLIKGGGAKKNMEEAIDYLDKASKQGHAESVDFLKEMEELIQSQ